MGASIPPTVGRQQNKNGTQISDLWTTKEGMEFWQMRSVGRNTAVYDCVCKSRRSSDFQALVFLIIKS